MFFPKLLLFILAAATGGSSFSLCGVDSLSVARHCRLRFSNPPTTREQYRRRTARRLASWVSPSLSLLQLAANPSSERDIPASSTTTTPATTDNAFQRCWTQMQACAQRTSQDEMAVEEAEALLHEFLATAGSTSTSNDVIALYNLLWETHAYSHRPDGADVINQQIKQMIQNHQQGIDGSSPSTIASVYPNIESFATLMDAYTRRSDLKRVEEIVEFIKATPNLEPDISVYNKLIRAYGVAGQPEKAQHVAQQLLRALCEDDNQAKASPSLRPNSKTWIHLLRAFAAKGRVEEIQDHIRNVMLRGYRLEGHVDWKPNVHSYNALMRAILYRKDGEFPEPQHEQIEGLLYDMIQLYRDEDVHDDDEEEDTGLFGMRPNSQTFYLVLQSFWGVTDASVGDKVDRILEIQRGLALACGENSLYPDTRTYNTAISALSRTHDSQKAQRALRMLEEMDPLDNDDEGAHNPSLNARPDLITYRNILNVCAFTRGPAEDRQAAFRVAVEIFNQARRNQPRKKSWRFQNSMVSIYQLFMKACFQLMARGDKRDVVVEKVFNRCCQEGYLSKQIVSQVFLRHASAALRSRLLGNFTADSDNPNLPDEWSRNVPT